MNKLFLRKGFVLLTTAIFLVGGFFVANEKAFAAVRNVSAVISPTTASQGQNQTYTYTVTNDALSTANIGSVKIQLPIGFTTPSSIIISATSPSRTWVLVSTAPYVGGFDPATGTIGIKANAVGDKLYVNEFVTIEVVTTAPAVAGAHEWTADVRANLNFGGQPFALTTPQPTVTIPKADQTIGFGALADKIYGDADFAVSATATSALAVTFSASVDCTVTPDGLITHITSAGNCDITASQIGDSNYNPAPDVLQSFAINQRAITVTADAKGKNFGDVDPALTYTITSGTLVAPDTFSGGLDRDPGENVGTYAINNTLDLGSNYDLTYVGALFTIAPNTITVTADPQTKVYGETDPTLSYQFTPALQGGDSFSGSLDRVLGEDVGDYGISQGDLSLSSNYNLSFTGDTLSITPAPVTVTADAKTKIYGAADPVLSYTSSDPSATFSGALARTAGENVGAYTINQGTLTNSNYTITFASDDLTINKKGINVTAVAKNKVVGDSDPVLTYTNSPLVGADTFSGALTRDPGETIGTYMITQGTLALSNNYTLNFVGANLEITAEEVIETSRHYYSEGRSGGQVLGASTEPQVLGAEKFIFTQLMKFGTKGGEVPELQKFLNAAAYNSGLVDGKFGSITRGAVKAFQAANPPLKVDGIVGPLTRAVLNK